jgi:tetratricopeptide (TPR) repeat protein
MFGVDTSGMNIAATNNMVYSTMFKHCNDRAILEQASKWIKLVCEAQPGEQDYLDTYANVLYKLGKKKKAIELEEKAASMNTRNSKEIFDNLQKMKEGQPTWL